MPNGMFALDADFPQFTGQETDRQRIDRIYDYLVQMQQTLRYCLQNLGSDNFNDKELENLSQTVLEPITLRVTNGKDSALLELLAGEALLSAQKIKFSGMVTFTNGENGETMIDGGTIWVDGLHSTSIQLAQQEGTGLCMDNLGLTFRVGKFTGSGAQQDVGGVHGDGTGIVISTVEGCTLRIVSSGPMTIGTEGVRLDLKGEVYVNGQELG